MSKTILMDVEGFTPIIDAVVDDTGLMSAVVFGRIWRFCQMEDNVCKASLQKIADGIGIDKATVQRHADKLCEAGYIKDLTPDLRNKPHIYIDTGKAGLKIGLSGTVAQSNVTVAEYNADIAQSNVTVAESQLNKVLNKDSKRVSKKKEESPATPKPKASDFPELVLHRSVVSHWCKPFQRQSIIDAVQKINIRLGRDATQDDLQPFFTEWGKVSGNDWSIVWLVDWAVSGKLPNGNKQNSGSFNNNLSILQSFAEKG